MTLTHSKSVRWADSATDMARHDGLSQFGERVIREMNRLGMMVDLSHVSVATMSDALAITEAPVIFSHSSVYQVVPHVRNVPDDILNLVAQNKGVVMVTFFPSYVSEETWMYGVNLERERARLVAKVSSGEASRMLERWRKENPAPKRFTRQEQKWNTIFKRLFSRSFWRQSAAARHHTHDLVGNS